MKNQAIPYVLVLLLGASPAVALAKTVVMPGSSAAYIFSPAAKGSGGAIAPDTDAPVLTLQDPANIAGVSANINAAINEAGKVYFVVQLKSVATAPTLAQVVAGKNSGGTAALSAGSNLSMTKDTQAIFNMTGLTELTEYKVYFVACDNVAPTANCTATPSSKEFKTLDATPPTTSEVAVTSTLATGASFTAKITEDGYGCYKVLASATPPTVDDAFKSSCTGQTMTANTIKTFGSIGGLTAGTTYYIYFLARDNAAPNNNWQTGFQQVKSFAATDVCSSQAVDVTKDTCCYAKNSDHATYGRASLIFGTYSTTGSGTSLGTLGTTMTYLKKTNLYSQTNWWDKVTTCP
ncbi:MAG: hypothetical protein H6R18_84 [Proteobacteria bacterium]|nr:hypothetical protein [Pseudomonadota bacterium]